MGRAISNLLVFEAGGGALHPRHRHVGSAPARTSPRPYALGGQGRAEGVLGARPAGAVDARSARARRRTRHVTNAPTAGRSERHETPCPPRRRGGRAAARPAAAPAHLGHPHSAFPKLIALPDGWQPEGIAIKRSTLLRRLDPHRRRLSRRRAHRPGRAARARARGARRHRPQGPPTSSCGWPAGRPARPSSTTRAPAPTSPSYACATGTRRSSTTSPSARREAYFTNSRAAEVFAVAAARRPRAPDRDRRRLRPDRRPDRHQPQRHRRRGGGARCVLVQTNTGKLFAADTRTGVAARDRPRRGATC